MFYHLLMTKQSKNSLKLASKIIKLENSISTKQQLQLAQQISLYDIYGEEALMELLIKRRIIQNLDFSSLDSILFEILYTSTSEKVQQTLQSYFFNGIVELKTSLKIDHQPLQNLLMVQNYKEADRLTQIQLCKLAGLDRYSKRDWLYFTDIPLLPSDDLFTIDLLWRMYSRDKFGFSRQRQIWLTNSSDWEKFWFQIGWTTQGVARRYPDEFMWDINAPQGHLPLFNQLRGVQVLSALFDHIAWNK
uniref:Ycf53 n=1 Tax=Anunuuluaehu liula TaxID=3049639 RepID=UPI003002AF03